MIQIRLSVLAALTGLFAPGAAAQADSDLVLLNGSIVVGDGPYTRVEAATVRDGRFVFLGSSAEAREYIGAATRVIDLGGRTAVAGLADNHLHDAGGGPGVDLSGARMLDFAAVFRYRFNPLWSLSYGYRRYRRDIDDQELQSRFTRDGGIVAVVYTF